MTIHRAVLLVAIGVGVGVSAVIPVGSFELGPHEQILRDALPANKLLEQYALDKIVSANKESDLHQLDSGRHFDNARNPSELCALWNQGLDVFLTRAVRWAAPVGLEKRDLDSRDQALTEFGWATHAIADFYSHTNWVELSTASWNGSGISQAQILGQSCSAGAFPPELHSGYFDLTSTSQGLGCNASAQAAGWECHVSMNKDHPGTNRSMVQYMGVPGQTNHTVALTVAKAATASAWQALKDRIEARYDNDTTDGKCVFMKLAWGGNRSCVKKWKATGTIKTHQEYAIQGGRLFHELDMPNMSVSFKIESLDYPGPNEPPVYADVRGSTRQRGTFCQWAVVRNITTPKTCMPYEEDTEDSDDATVKVTPEAEPIELDWRVTFPGKKPDCGTPQLIRLDPLGTAGRQPFLNCPGGAPGLTPVTLTYSGSFEVAPE